MAFTKKRVPWFARRDRALEGLLKQNGLPCGKLPRVRRDIGRRDETIENSQGARLKMT